MYNQSAQWSSRRRGSHPVRAAERRRQGLAARERTRLLQLAVCAALFAAVFIGKGVFPQRVEQLRGDLQAALSSDTDFRSAFVRLGESLAGEGTVLGELGAFCVEVFGPAQGDEALLDPAVQVQAAQDFLNQQASEAEQAAYYLRMDQVPEEWFQHSETSQEEPAAAETAQAVPAVGTVVWQSDYSGQPLPENYTMDCISLGDLQTVTPVLGHLRSEYGYRDHPVDGEYKFHNGVDIGGQEGDPIGAFAAGTVDYIGENDDHGLYLQIDHGNGIKSFYAHCSKLCVSQGQTVAAGEKVAEVGSTGVSTGPHLHLEVKWNGLHLNPAYYVEFLTG